MHKLSLYAVLCLLTREILDWFWFVKVRRFYCFMYYIAHVSVYVVARLDIDGVVHDG